MNSKTQPPTPIKPKTKEPNSTKKQLSSNNKKPNSQQLTIIKKRKSKPNIKLQYLQTQCEWLQNFKDFLEDINTLSKQTISQRNGRQNKQIQKDSKERGYKRGIQEKVSTKKNSFQLGDPIQKYAQTSKTQQKQKSNNHQSQFLSQTMSSSALKNISKVYYSVSSKAKQLQLEVLNMKTEKKQKQTLGEQFLLYDNLQALYDGHLTLLQRILQNSQMNVQNVEIIKKNSINLNPTIKGNLGQQQIGKPILVGLGKINSVNNQSVREYLKVINNIKKQLKAIHQLNKQIKIQINSQQLQPNTFLSNKNQEEIQLQNLSQHYKKENKNKNLLKIQKLPSQNARVIHKINKQILNHQLAKTKQKIIQYKMKNETIQSSIKQLEYYKVMHALELNKKEQTIKQNQEQGIQNSKIKRKQKKKTNRHKQLLIEQKQNNKFQQDVLLIILQHQFLSKRLSLFKATHFQGIRRKQVTSSDSQCMKSQFEKYLQQARTKNTNKYRNYSLNNKKLSQIQFKPQNSEQVRRAEQQMQIKSQKNGSNDTSKKAQSSTQTNSS